MKNKIISKLLIIIMIVSATIQIGMFLGYFILSNTDFNKYKVEYEIQVAK